MPRVINNKTGEMIDVKDGEPIRPACEEIGIPFSCRDGVCGTCMIDVVDGSENLTKLTEAEKDLARDDKHRLACQCCISGGDVKVDF